MKASTDAAVMGFVSICVAGSVNEIGYENTEEFVRAFVRCIISLLSEPQPTIALQLGEVTSFLEHTPSLER